MKKGEVLKECAKVHKIVEKIKKLDIRELYQFEWHCEKEFQEIIKDKEFSYLEFKIINALNDIYEVLEKNHVCDVCARRNYKDEMSGKVCKRCKKYGRKNPYIEVE